MKTSGILIVALLLAAGSFAQPITADTLKPEMHNTASAVKPAKQKGYYNVLQAGFMFGNIQVADLSSVYMPYNPNPIISPEPYPVSYLPYLRTEMTVAPSFTVTNGYMFNPHWAVGAGVGFEIFDHNYFPLFAELRYTLWDDRITPFVAIKGGYSFCSFETRHYNDLYLNWFPYYITDASLRNYGGALFHPEIGVKIPLSHNSDLLFTVAYRYQKTRSVARVEYDNAQFSEWEHKEEINRLSFGVAVIFK